MRMRVSVAARFLGPENVESSRGYLEQLWSELVIALAKIVGLEVGPVTLQSRISAPESLSSRSRESVSSQIDPPAS